jgi:predicted nucleic acid-binding protein
MPFVIDVRQRCFGVELARRIDVPLATLDTALLKAAPPEGVILVR